MLPITPRLRMKCYLSYYYFINLTFFERRIVNLFLNKFLLKK
jgi:hypothetical protein